MNSAGKTSSSTRRLWSTEAWLQKETSGVPWSRSVVCFPVVYCK